MYYNLEYNENVMGHNYKFSSEYRFNKMDHLINSPFDQLTKKSQLLIPYDSIQRDKIDLATMEAEINECF